MGLPRHALRGAQHQLLSAVYWWRRQDKHYGVWWRAGNGLLAVMILAGIVIPVVQQIIHNNAYKLSADALKLVGHTNPMLSKQLTYDAQTQTYQFNQGAVRASGSQDGAAGATGALAAMQAQVGTASGKGSDKSLYALTVPQDFSKGVTYTDTNTQLSFSLVPQFTSLDGKIVDSHIVFPLHGDTQAVYTLKGNGLKEDIVVNNPIEDTMSFSYKLSLPKTLEAKVIPGSDGNIGIYSADPILFGNITYGSSSDQANVQRARVNSPKTNLVFGLPRPVIKDTSGNTIGSSRFVLAGNTLQVVASGLTSAKTAVTIDPSVVVTSASDFAGGNNEDNIDFSTSGQITRGGLTGGTLGTWGSANTGTTFSVRNSVTSIAYNGYLYAVGGANGGTSYADVYYAPILGSGQVGTWVQTSSILVSRTNTSLITYNGYLYMITGSNQGNTSFDDVEYALICTGSNSGKDGCSSTTGSLGTWLYANGTASQGGSAGTSVDGSRLMQAVSGAMVVGYNDFIYVMGGCTTQPVACTVATNLVQVARVKADGTLSAWTSQGTLPATRYGGGAVAYNNHVYIAGGCTAIGINCTASTGDTIIAPINSDGTLGSWATSAYTFASPYIGINLYAYHGYLYYLDGSTGNQNANYAQYAPIYASGLIGPWQSTSVYATPTSDAGYTVYNGYAYQVAGCTASSLNCTTYTNAVAYAPINPPGVLATYQTNANSLSTSGGLWGGTSVAYNGYMYILGGLSTNSVASYVNTVYYAKLNSDGSTGTWSPTSAFTTARAGLAAVAYNGYMYIMGGVTGSSVYGADVQYAQINSDGTLGSWASAGGNYSTTGRMNLSATVYDGYLYVMGGDYNNDSNVSAETNVGHIQSNGTVSGWTTTGSLVNPTSEYALAQDGAYVYILGGRTQGTGGTNYDNKIEYAILNGSGTVTWNSISNVFANPRASFTGGANNGFVYITGGLDLTTQTFYSDTQYARICMDTSTTDGCNGTVGTLGTWHTTSSFTTGRYGQMGTVYNGYMYIMGGCANTNGILLGNCNTASNVLSDVQYAQINNGGPGTTGSWASTSSFSGSRQGAQSVAYNGYLYELGGQSNVATTFSYTGAPQTYTVPTGITKLTIEAYGAQGGTGASSVAGGLGGLAEETINVTPGETLQINVGGQGGNGPSSGTTPTPGGWNGGGAGGINTSNGSASGGGGGGGGATDIRQGGTALSNRVLVAGGGGGSGGSYSSDLGALGGDGGGTNGGGGSSTSAGGGGGGGTQSAGGAAGGYGSTAGGSTTQDQGGAGGKEGSLAAIVGGGGGGGGYWGGGGGGDNHSGARTGGGGGGSGFATGTNASMQTGVRSGNGQVNILLPTYYNDAQYAKLTSTGAIATDSGCGSSWCSTASFTNARSNFAAQVYNGYMYIAGGETTTAHYNDAQYAKLTSTGAIATDSGCGSSWCSTASFTTGRSSLASAMNNGYMYLLGGTDGASVYNSVQYAQLTSSGAIASNSGCGSAWCSTTGFTTARSGHSSIVNGGYLYLLGGTNGTNIFSDVQYAKLTSTGALASDSGCGSAWCTTTSFPTARSDHTSWTYDGYMYMAGGLSSSSTYLNDVQFAPILANGALGNWRSTASFSTARGSHATAVYNGYAYILGGCTADSPCITYANDVQYAPLQSTPRIAHYSKLIDLGSAANVTGLRFNGTTGGAVSEAYRAAGTDGVFGASTSTSSIVSSGCTSNVASTHYLLVMVTLDDSYGQGTGGSFPDSAGTAANLTDFTVDYNTGHPPPNIRLRAGQTLQAGDLSALDTCS